MNTLTRPYTRRLWIELFSLLALGTGAGFLNGLLGTGGGILLVFALKKFSSGTLPIRFADGRDIFANALAVMLPLSLFSVGRYTHAGALDPLSFAPLILPAIAGGVFGGWLLDRLKLPFLQALFALLLLWSGGVMLFQHG